MLIQLAGRPFFVVQISYFCSFIRTFFQWIENLTKKIPTKSLSGESHVQRRPVPNAVSTTKNLTVRNAISRTKTISKAAARSVDSTMTMKVVQNAFSNDWLRVYTNSDVIGVSICSSLKNVIALASGILSGLGMLVNSQAALITRGMAEITRFVVKMGGKAETCLGLTGIGDLVLTCTSNTSRNFQAGFEIGKYGIKHFKENNTKTVEGVYAVEIAKQIADELGIYSPITTAVYNTVFLEKSPKEEIAKMMRNSLKSE